MNHYTSIDLMLMFSSEEYIYKIYSKLKKNEDIKEIKESTKLTHIIGRYKLYHASIKSQDVTDEIYNTWFNYPFYTYTMDKNYHEEGRMPNRYYYFYRDYIKNNIYYITYYSYND